MQGFISSVGNIDSGGQGGAGESFVKLIVDLTSITPTTETVNSKEYNKFTFNKTNLTFKTVSPLGDEESVAVDDALIYKLFPISNNNEDKGINISYDGTTFSGYVLAQESTLTTVTFMFAYYIVLTQTSVVWQNYVDMVGSGGSTVSLYLNQMQVSGYWLGSAAVTGTANISFYSATPINSLSDLRAFLSTCPTLINYNNKGIWLSNGCITSYNTQTLIIHTIEFAENTGNIFLQTYNMSGGDGPTLGIYSNMTGGTFSPIKII